jgi:hypothetical protein
MAPDRGVPSDYGYAIALTSGKPGNVVCQRARRDVENGFIIVLTPFLSVLKL